MMDSSKALRVIYHRECWNEVVLDAQDLLALMYFDVLVGNDKNHFSVSLPAWASLKTLVYPPS
jgi:hypothetical protein